MDQAQVAKRLVQSPLGQILATHFWDQLPFRAESKVPQIQRLQKELRQTHCQDQSEPCWRFGQLQHQQK